MKAKKFGLSDQEYNDALCLERLYSMINEYKLCCSLCYERPVYVETENLAFLCSFHGKGRKRSKKIGEERLTEKEMERLFERYRWTMSNVQHKHQNYVQVPSRKKFHKIFLKETVEKASHSCERYLTNSHVSPASADCNSFANSKPKFHSRAEYVSQVFNSFNASHEKPIEVPQARNVSNLHQSFTQPEFQLDTQNELLPGSSSPPFYSRPSSPYNGNPIFCKNRLKTQFTSSIKSTHAPFYKSSPSRYNANFLQKIPSNTEKNNSSRPSEISFFDIEKSPHSAANDFPLNNPFSSDLNHGRDTNQKVEDFLQVYLPHGIKNNPFVNREPSLFPNKSLGNLKYDNACGHPITSKPFHENSTLNDALKLCRNGENWLYTPLHRFKVLNASSHPTNMALPNALPQSTPQQKKEWWES